MHRRAAHGYQLVTPLLLLGTITAMMVAARYNGAP
jgi:hypothetical protein